MEIVQTGISGFHLPEAYIGIPAFDTSGVQVHAAVNDFCIITFLRFKAVQFSVVIGKTFLEEL